MDTFNRKSGAEQKRKQNETSTLTAKRSGHGHGVDPDLIHTGERRWITKIRR